MRRTSCATVKTPVRVIPTNAANESETLMINNPTAAISLLKNNAAIELPISKKDAPVICFSSFVLVKIEKIVKISLISAQKSKIVLFFPLHF